MPITSTPNYRQYDLLNEAKFAKEPPAEVNRGDDVIAIAFQALAPLWSSRSTPHVYQSDNYYLCPSLEAAREIIELSRRNRRQWIENAFDCDDFAILLKADFSLCSYQNGSRQGGYAFGIVWFNQIRPHAMNWMINDDALLRFVEPQNGDIIERSEIVARGRSAITLAVL